MSLRRLISDKMWENNTWKPRRNATFQYHVGELDERDEPPLHWYVVVIAAVGFAAGVVLYSLVVFFR